MEIAARWKGEVRAFNGVVTRLKLPDTGGDMFQIHAWREHNAWQSEAENRSNASRLSRMAKTLGKKTPKAKSTPEPIAEDSDAYKLALLMHDTLKASVPTLKEPNVQKWVHSLAKARSWERRPRGKGMSREIAQKRDGGEAADSRQLPQ